MPFIQIGELPENAYRILTIPTNQAGTKQVVIKGRSITVLSKGDTNWIMRIGARTAAPIQADDLVDGTHFTIQFDGLWFELPGGGSNPIKLFIGGRG